jgi:hypothetical protein
MWPCQWRTIWCTTATFLVRHCYILEILKFDFFFFLVRCCYIYGAPLLTLLGAPLLILRVRH